MSLALGHGHDATTGWLRCDRGAVRRRLHVHAPHGPTGFGGGAGGARGVRRGRWRLGRDRLPRDSPARRRHACDHQLDAGGTRRPLCAGRCLRRDGRRTDQAVVAGGSRLFGHAVRARCARRRRHRRRGRRARRRAVRCKPGKRSRPRADVYGLRRRFDLHHHRPERHVGFAPIYADIICQTGHVGKVPKAEMDDQLSKRI